MTSRMTPKTSTSEATVRDFKALGVQESVYAIQFSSGTVKVGRSFDFDRRLKEHTKTALAHGVTVTGEWHALVDNGSSAESNLMWLAGAVGGTSIKGNREYFAGANFEALVELATQEYGDFATWMQDQQARLANF